MGIMSNLITAVAICIAGYQDLKRREVSDVIVKAALIAVMCCSGVLYAAGITEEVQWKGPLFALILTFFTRDFKYVGGADLDAALLILGTTAGMFPLTLGIACFLGLILPMTEGVKKDNIPFVTMMAAGYIMVSGADLAMMI